MVCFFFGAYFSVVIWDDLNWSRSVVAFLMVGLFGALCLSLMSFHLDFLGF